MSARRDGLPCKIEPAVAYASAMARSREKLVLMWEESDVLAASLQRKFRESDLLSVDHWVLAALVTLVTALAIRASARETLVPPVSMSAHFCRNVSNSSARTTPVAEESRSRTSVRRGMGSAKRVADRGTASSRGRVSAKFDGMTQSLPTPSPAMPRGKSAPTGPEGVEV